MVLSEQYKNVNPCEACQLLGQASRDTGDELLLVTLSPNPEWKDYGELIPFLQHSRLQKLHLNPHIHKFLSTQYHGALRILSEHYEFTKSGQLHSHCLFAIPKQMLQPDVLQTISKTYHKVIGRQYCRSTICCDVRRITDDGIYQYLNKENIYPPKHNNNLLIYMPQDDHAAELLTSDSDTE